MYLMSKTNLVQIVKAVAQNTSSRPSRHFIVERHVPGSAQKSNLPLFNRINSNSPSSYLLQINTEHNPVNFPFSQQVNFVLSLDSINTYNIFTGLDPSTGPAVRGGTTFLLARIESWIQIVVKTCTVQNTCGGTRKNQYRDLFNTALQLFTIQIVGTVN